MNLSPLPIQKFFDNNGDPLTGGLLFTYVAVTTTKLATYTDSSGASTNTNPIVLNFRGEANVWLDQTLTYKFVLAPEGDTDPPTRPIWSVDNISAAITYASLTQQIIGQLLYPRTLAEITASVVPLNYAYPELNILRYGAVGNDSTDCTAALQNAMAVARINHGEIFLPIGTYRYATTLAVNTTMAIRGAGFWWQTVLKKTANFVGITVTGSCSLRNFTLDRTGADSSAGITIRDQARCDFRDLYIKNQGSHGLWPQQTSLSSFYNLICESNAGDGVRLDATVVPLGPNSYVNANQFINIDTRGNTGNGWNMVQAYSNFGASIISQGNTGRGIRLDDARANNLQFYSEANSTSPGVELTNNVNCRGNILYSVQDDGVLDNSINDSNMIFRPNNAGSFEAFVRSFRAMKLICPETGYDGNSYQGTLALTHIANRDFALTADGFAGSQILRLRNAQTGGLDVLADRLELDTVRLKAVAPTVSAAQVGIGSTTASTVGAAGGAAALPANPTGYWIINVSGTAFKVPYYAS